MPVEASRFSGHSEFTRPSAPRVRPQAAALSGASRAASSHAAMDIDSAPTNHSFPINRDHPQHSDGFTAQCGSSSGDSCCSASRGNAEMRAILNQFKEVVDNALAQTAKVHANKAGEAPPPSLCSHCTRFIGTYIDGQGDWFSCESCHVVVVSE